MATYLEYLNEHLIKEDNKNPRIVSKFYKDYFPTNVISKTKDKSYVILDLGHLFTASNIKKGYAHFFSSYNPLERDNNLEFKLITTYPDDVINLNSVGRLFKVNDDNTVITYLDKKRSLGLEMSSGDGLDDLDYLLNTILTNQMEKVLPKYNRDKFFLKNLVKPVYLKYFKLSKDVLSTIIWNNNFNNPEELLTIIKREINFTNEAALNQEIHDVLRPYLR